MLLVFVSVKSVADTIVWNFYKGLSVPSHLFKVSFCVTKMTICSRLMLSAICYGGK